MSKETIETEEIIKNIYKGFFISQQRASLKISKNSKSIHLCGHFMNNDCTGSTLFYYSVITYYR